MRGAIVKWWPEDLFGPRPTLNDLRSVESIAGLLDKAIAAYTRKIPVTQLQKFSALIRPR